MRTTERFEKAVAKLYQAFHDGTLDAVDCKKCAVGNMCGGESYWTEIRSLGQGANNVPDVLIERLKKETGYSQRELIDIEYVFMHGYEFYSKKVSIYKKEIRAHIGRFQSDKSILKQQQFYALCAVIEYLCELDNIPNPMDYSKLFETENDKAKYELESVLI